MKGLGKPARDNSPDSSRLDWEVLDGLVKRGTVRDLPTPQKFSIYVLRTLFKIPEHEALDAITDGSGDRGVDAVFIDEFARAVHLFQFKYHEVEDHSSKYFPGRCVDTLISFVEELFAHDPKIFASCNKLLQAKIRQILDLINAGPVSLHIHLASNGRRLEAPNYSRLKSSIDKYDGVVWQHSASDLAKQAIRPKHGKDRRRLTFFGQGRCEYSTNNIRMITGLVELKELARFLCHLETPLQIDHTLFAENVRGVLGLENEVNRSIAKTLHSKNCENFAFLNNGITIVSEQVLHQVGANFPTDVINPQIVNGCQTASMIHEAWKSNQALFDRTENPPTVQVRIIESADPQFMQTVALSTNSQTRIYGRDLRAVDDIQLKIEKALRHHGYHYLRKRSDRSDVPTSQTIDMSRLAQNILSYYLQDPQLAKTSNELFNDLYDRIFDAQLITTDRIIAVHILSNMLEDRRQLARQRLRSIDRKKYSEEWIIEGHFHVLFALGIICDRDGVELSDLKGATLRLMESIDVVGEFSLRHSSVAAYRLFRSSETTDAIRKIIAKTRRQELGLPQYDLFADPVIGQLA